MLFAALQRFFASSPAIHLLRSPNAPWLLPFLNQTFKQSGNSTCIHSELAASLDEYLAELAQSADPNQTVIAPQNLQTSASYLAFWCSADVGWLKRFIDDQHSEPCYQLTSDTEMVLSFVQKATRQQPWIGTRTQLRSILSLLDEVALTGANALVGPETETKLRIERLTNQRAEIDRQLELLRSNVGLRVANVSGQAPLIREQFTLAVTQLEQLKSEFRAVEERFKSITRGVQQRLSDCTSSRGEIIDFALNAEDILKASDQGHSFFEFLKLVHSPEIQDRVTSIVQQLTQLDALADQYDSLQSIRAMIPTLLAEAEKILRTTHHLSSTLRRLLDSRSTRHHQQLARLLRDIRSEAAKLSASPPADIGLEMEVEIELQAPFERAFWSQPEPFAEVELQAAPTDLEQHDRVLEQLAALQRIDWSTMRRNIAHITDRGNSVPISDLVERFPIQTGTIELLAYIQIAHEDGHEIDRRNTIELTSWWDDPLSQKPRTLRLPNVIFLPLDTRRKRRSSALDNNQLAAARAALPLDPSEPKQ